MVLSKIDIIKKLKEFPIEIISIEGKGNLSKITYKCKRCNTIKIKTFGNIRNPYKCFSCQYKTYDTEWFKNQLESILGKEYELFSSYKNSKTKVKIIHKKCNNVYETSPNRIITGHTGCPFCNGGMTLTADKVFSIFKKRIKNSENFELIKDDLYYSYKNTNDILNILHKECGNIISKRGSMLTRGSVKIGCSICSKNKAYDDQTFLNKVRELTGEEYDILTPYTNISTPVLFYHRTCKSTFLRTPSNFISHTTLCPNCNKNGFSNEEKELLTFIKEVYNGKIIKNSRKILNGKEIDIYLPDLKIGIEFDGLYWHSEKNNTDKKYHLNKTNEAEMKGIHLIHIYEDEWIYKKEIVKSKLAHIMNLNHNEKIYARNCYIEEISFKEKNNFLENNHIQGKDISSLRYGLYWKENKKLVAVMTFSKLRKIYSSSSKETEKNSYELIRYCSDINYRLIGGFSKLFSNFIKEINPDTVLTFADRRWSIKSSNVYNSLFKLDHISKESYDYVDINKNNKRYNRFSFRKSVLKEKFPETYKEELTEREIMELNNFYRVWNCGNLVYKYKKKEKR